MRSVNLNRWLLVAYLSFPIVERVQAAPFTFQGLGDLPGGGFASTASDVSADGSVVVGTGLTSSGTMAFRWTNETGMVGLGSLSTGFTQSSSAYGISADGTTIVGSVSSIQGGDSRLEAMRWTNETGMTGLGDLPGGKLQSVAFAASADGSVIVGQGTSASNKEAMRWTSSGLVGLGLLSSGDTSSTALDVSADGSVIVGSSDKSLTSRQAVRWNAANEIEALPNLGPNDSSFASSASSDASIIVGRAGPSAVGVRWTTGGVEDLSGRIRLAEDVSADGSVIVGSGRSDLSPNVVAYLWSPLTDSVLLGDYLLNHGVSAVAGWELTGAIGVSADGKTIVGYGTNPEGQQEAWLARIPNPLPPPGDANLDGLVDGADYTVWADGFLMTGQTWEGGDFNGDGIVDGADYTIWADHFAPAQLSLSAVPEPSTLALACIGALALAVTAARQRLA